MMILLVIIVASPQSLEIGINVTYAIIMIFVKLASRISVMNMPYSRLNIKTKNMKGKLRSGLQ